MAIYITAFSSVNADRSRAEINEDTENIEIIEEKISRIKIRRARSLPIRE